MSGLHLGINHSVTNIYGELALFQTLYQGSSVRCSFVPHEAFVNVWTRFFSIVQIFYLNLKFSTIIKTGIMKTEEKSRIRRHSGHGNLVEKWQWEPVRTVQLAQEALVRHELNGR